MKILYLLEYNMGGGPKATLNLASSASDYAEVAFLGIDHNFPEYKSVDFFEATARRPIGLKYFIDLCKTLQRFDPDIVHATGMYTALISLWARSLKKKRFRIMMTLHHTNDKFRFNFLAKKLVHFLNRIDMIQYLTAYQKKLYKNFGLNPQRYSIVPNVSFIHSYPEEKVQALRSHLITETAAQWLIVYVGRLDESKQLEMFIETIRKINLQEEQAAGVIVGSGDRSYTKRLKNLASELNIASRILFTGFTLQPELYIKACDFSLFPTLHNEALPLFILESFSQQKTMVVSHHPSILGIVSDHLDALIAEEHNADIYASRCLEIIRNPDLRKRLESEALHTYNRCYKPEKITDEFHSIYVNLMESLQVC